MIEVDSLTKHYGSAVAVDDLSFTVEPGMVTGFLGPNGAGKSTTMRMIVGLDNPTSGRATIGGKLYRDIKNPLHEVGALLDAKAVHAKRSARSHLNWIAESNGIPRSRVEEVLDIVGLTDVAKRPAGSFSLGMGQRLGLAVALLGDPGVLLLDEPVNGLDPEGIRWVREFLKTLAHQGRTILVSSHLLSEMSQTADKLVVIGKGRLVYEGSTHEFVKQSSDTSVIVRTPNHDELKKTLDAQSISYREFKDEDGRPAFSVADSTSDQIGAIAFATGIMLSELSEKHSSLEDVFMKLTSDTVEYHGLDVSPTKKEEK